MMIIRLDSCILIDSRVLLHDEWHFNRRYCCLAFSEPTVLLGRREEERIEMKDRGEEEEGKRGREIKRRWNSERDMNAEEEKGRLDSESNGKENKLIIEYMYLFILSCLIA